MKTEVIPDVPFELHGSLGKGGDRKACHLGMGSLLSACWWGNGLPRRMTGSWSKRMVSHTGTETLPRLLREAAVENI